MQIDELIWDEKNIAHISRHNIIPEEVEEVCNSGVAHVTKSRNKTLRLLDQTDAGRYLAIFLADKGKHKFYVVTARDADKSERRLYKKR